GLSVGSCDEHGAFEVTEVLPGRITLTAVAADGATLAATAFDLREGELREGIVLYVDQTRIHCHVTSEGAAVARATVSCDDGSPIDVEESSALTDGDGRCELLVANVPFHLVARAGRQQVVRSLLAPPAEMIELELGSGGGADARTRTPQIV